MENILNSLKDKIICDICNSYPINTTPDALAVNGIYCECNNNFYYENKLVKSFIYSSGLFLWDRTTNIKFENYYTHFDRYVNNFDYEGINIYLHNISFSYLNEYYKFDDLVECILFANKLTKKAFENSIFI